MSVDEAELARLRGQIDGLVARLEAAETYARDLTGEVRAGLGILSTRADAERDRVDAFGRRLRQLEAPDGER